MRYALKMLLVGGALAVASGTAAARDNISFGLSIGTPYYSQPAPAYYGPRYYAPPRPVYYEPYYRGYYDRTYYAPAYGPGFGVRYDNRSHYRHDYRRHDGWRDR